VGLCSPRLSPRLVADYCGGEYSMWRVFYVMMFTPCFHDGRVLGLQDVVKVLPKATLAWKLQLLDESTKLVDTLLPKLKCRTLILARYLCWKGVRRA